MTDCRVCKRPLPPDGRAYVTAKGKRYLDKRCAECRRAYRRQYYVEHREAEIAQVRALREMKRQRGLEIIESILKRRGL